MTTRANRVLTSWGPVVLYCGAIFVESSYSTPDGLPSFFMSDKLLHAAAYAVMAILFYRALGPHRIGASPVKRAVFAIAFTVAYGISDEIHQSFVPGRSPETLDVVADAVGALAGVVMARRFTVAMDSRRGAPSD